jgi:RND family efflux transporter MFP subunit
MRFLVQSLTGLVLLSLTLGLVAYAGALVFSAVEERMSAEPNMPERRERVFAVSVVEARAQTVTPKLTAYGEILSRRTLEIRAKTPGSVVALAPEFEDGGTVTAGQLLARIDPTDAQFALERAESELRDSEAETREARRALELAREEATAAEEQARLRDQAYQRQVDLQERGVGTAAAVETAELAASSARQAVITRRQAIAQAEARVDQAATRLARSQIAFDEAQRRLEETEITAGFSGRLSDVSVVEGRLVSANERLGTLVDTGALEVSFRVPTAAYARLVDERGALISAPVTAYLSTGGADLTARGVISRESAAVSEGQTGRLIYARLYEAPAMKPGDFVTVEVEEPALDQVVRLPASSLGPDGGVLVLDDENRLEALPVTLLRRQGDRVLVRGDGLEGRRVVASRTPLLGAGIKVRPLEPARHAGRHRPGRTGDGRRHARSDRGPPRPPTRLCSAKPRDPLGGENPHLGRA